MAFWIRYKDANGVYQEITLSPGPTAVEYPDARLFKMHSTQDGATVIQRPLRDSRSRKWVWNGYRSYILPYENQWKVLESLDYRERAKAGLEPTIQVWENESGIGGFNATSGGNKVWTTVKVVHVNRVLRGGGGPPTFDVSSFEFVLADGTFTAF